MQRHTIDERAGLAIDRPAGEGACGVLDVGLAVVPLAQGEQLEQLAREVLVGLAGHRARAVEVDQHRRIARHRLQQPREIAEGLAAEQLVLAVESRRVTHLGERRGEMVVPEQRHPLDLRLVGREHLLGPPVAQLAALLLDRPGDLERLAVDPLFLDRLLLQATDGGRSFVDPGWRRRQRVRTPVGHQAINCCGVVQRLDRSDLGRRRAEGSPRQKMAGLVEPHCRCGMSAA
jgi:hypothetical protein